MQDSQIAEKVLSAVPDIRQRLAADQRKNGKKQEKNKKKISKNCLTGKKSCDNITYCAIIRKYALLIMGTNSERPENRLKTESADPPLDVGIYNQNRQNIA